MLDSKHARRNAGIGRLRVKELILESIGARVHLTDERVRQILHLAPGPAMMLSRLNVQHRYQRTIGRAVPAETSEAT